MTCVCTLVAERIANICSQIVHADMQIHIKFYGKNVCSLIFWSDDRKFLEETNEFSRAQNEKSNYRVSPKHYYLLLCKAHIIIILEITLGLI